MKHEDSMMRNVAKQAGSLVVGVLIPAICWAHPGHGADGGNWSGRHYFTEPVHLAILQCEPNATVLRRATSSSTVSPCGISSTLPEQ